MSNEKPVRITVGDVKEVAEATAIQEEAVSTRSVSAVNYKASVPDTSGNGMIYIGVLKNEPKTSPAAANAPAISAPTSNTEAPTSMPGAPNANASTDANAPAASNNAPAPASAPEANNVSK
jgi:hypothetical protein